MFSDVLCVFFFCLEKVQDKICTRVEIKTPSVKTETKDTCVEVSLGIVGIKASRSQVGSSGITGHMY